MRFLAIVCLISLLLSVAIITKTSANASTSTCIWSNSSPIVIGTPIVPTPTQPSVVLNEILPSPHTSWNCAYANTPNGQQNAWIELYNLQDHPLNLYTGRTCIDTGPNTIQACLPLGLVIPAHGFLTFFPYLISNRFTLTGVSTLRLLLAYVPVDQINVPTLSYDVSYARVPDGTGTWRQDLIPSINSSNAVPISPSPTPTRLNKKHSSSSKTTSQGRKKYTKSTGVGNSNTSSQAVESTTANNNTPMQNDSGKQTQWHNLQFPSSLESPSAFSAAENISSPSPSPPAENVSQKMLFSLLGISGLLSIWWGWRRFFKKKQ